MFNVKIFAVLVVLVLVLFLAVLSWSRYRKTGAPKPVEAQRNPYLGLRDMALHASREKLGIPASETGAVWGFLMDWAIGNATATIVAYSDGNASVYLSSGGGFLGGIGKEPIRNAAKNAVAIANASKNSATLTTTYPMPEQGEVIFYLLTDEGVRTARASETELRSHQHAFSRLGDAAQAIVTAYRQDQSKPQ